MKCMLNIISTTILLLILSLFSLLSVTFAGGIDTKIEYELAIAFDLEKKQLHGTAHITLPAEKDLTLYLNGIETTGILIQNRQSPPATIKLLETSQINIPPAKIQQEVFISYRKTVELETDNFIEKEGITLISNWHPQPSKDVFFSLSAKVPQGFSAITETDHLDSSIDDTFSFSFSHPISSLNFIAAPFSINSLEVRPGLNVYTFLYKEDRELAKDYLKAASDYLLLYEESVGQYPYNHFAIVENIRPTGYGMPTFTLLGKMVIRLPFIINTSLGHEILHSWFGNGVRVDDASGNWSEGLTSYLSDWMYKERQGDGPSNRKEHIIKYLSYVPDNNNVPLESFRSASHNQPMANAVRSVGYIKGAMIFHELKNRIGTKHFEDSISYFFKKYQDRKASWEDLKNTFEEVSQLTLDSFFSQRLTRKDIPVFSVEDIRTDSASGDISLFFTLTQKTTDPYNLLVPIVVETSRGSVKFTEELVTLQKNVELKLESTPLKLTIDPHYDLLRSLDEEEKVPTWSQILGAPNKTVIVSPDSRELFAPLIQFFSQQNSKITDVNNVKNSDLEKDNLIFLGINNKVSRSLFGLPEHPVKGLTLDVRTHPLNTSKTIVLVSCSDIMELKKALRRLPHYGKYSYLHFENGRMKEKKVVTTDMGMQYSIEEPLMAFASSPLVTIADLVPALTDIRAIYIGETHNSMSDHNLQFRIIEELFYQNPELAIGMEMFPQSRQKALDDYILGKQPISEKEFLKQSEYFQVWKYDYRYYRKIVDFAKKNKIPIVALNTDRNIVSSIFKTGSTDALTDKEQSELPVDRNLGMPGYHQRLSTIHGYHMQGDHGKGNIGGFIQAQGLWDEVMAKNIAAYLKNNPKKRMIILAGSQHTRKDSGIPPRVERRLPIKQYSMLSANSFTKPSPAIADYYFFTIDHSLPPAGKIGITLEEKEKDGEVFLQISKISPHSKAVEADIQEDDTLLSINGYSVKDMEDVRIAMVDARPKEDVLLKLKRISNSLQTELLTVTVELYHP